MKYKKRDLLDIYNKAIKNYEDTSIDTILCTVFTAKGMTIDEVFVNKDLKITEDSDDEDKRLLYVAYSRAKHILHTDKGELIL
jgi:DNA helicase IV